MAFVRSSSSNSLIWWRGQQHGGDGDSSSLAAAAWQQQLGGSRRATAAAVTAAQQRAISCRQGECNNQQGREAATEGSGVGTDGRTIARESITSKVVTEVPHSPPDLIRLKCSLYCASALEEL
jgi:hypothetical protein